MYYAKDVSEMITGGKKYPPSYLKGEIKELYQAIKDRDMGSIKEETADVAYAAQMLLHQNTGINFPLAFGSVHVDKYKAREAMWKRIMEPRGVTYNPDLLVGGGNYRKPQKIRAALAAGGYNISDRELKSLEGLVGGFEEPINKTAFYSPRRSHMTYIPTAIMKLASPSPMNVYMAGINRANTLNRAFMNNPGNKKLMPAIDHSIAQINRMTASATKRDAALKTPEYSNALEAIMKRLSNIRNKVQS